ncbi:ankyrin 2,3/unc44, putative [Acanthamoeba castellanii str. Neff]|uniref:Ankyrin 2,3/unc44, putative n=1 Tax=Acanthamoeba castellanii (strain ATCC 30010 / Neff) TaxID=1257118 RepID=L8GZ79_ACACF|nr:ankyrin 2,3/unc44, putative [Acanthamoeba castellanii str. Neff]ELR18305.1 ankyrin 2,3/unc44, putative [Acanthamoeba castellanii str. Neff]
MSNTTPTKHDNIQRCIQAAYEGDLDTVKSLTGYRCIRTLERAIEGGHLPVIEFILSEGSAIQRSSCRDAIAAGHFEVLKFLRSRGAKLDHGVVYMAAQVGRIDMLHARIRQRLKADIRTFGHSDAAAQTGGLELGVSCTTFYTKTCFTRRWF